jgi:hypothetical protein
MTSTDPPGQIPRSVHLFERVQITALAIGWVNATSTYNLSLRERINPYLFGAVLIVVSVAIVLLIHRISRRRSAMGVWLLVAISGLFAVPWVVLVRHVGLTSWTGMLLVFQGLLQIASLALLATHDSRLWIDER